MLLDVEALSGHLEGQGNSGETERDIWIVLTSAGNRRIHFRTSVKPWTEIIVRSLGNDQDLFGSLAEISSENLHAAR